MTRVFLPWNEVVVVENDCETFTLDHIRGIYFEYYMPDRTLLKVSSTNYTVADSGDIELRSATVSVDGISGLRDTLFDISWQKFIDAAEAAEREKRGKR